jgi:hypothetical protein
MKPLACRLRISMWPAAMLLLAGCSDVTSGFPEFQGILSQVRGEGRYTFSAIMFMPAGAEKLTATIQFEQLTPSNRFLHLDLLPDNQVRIDDNETTKFGTFPRDQPFIVQVTLDTTSTPNAHFVLSGRLYDPAVAAAVRTSVRRDPTLDRFPPYRRILRNHRGHYPPQQVSPRTKKAIVGRDEASQITHVVRHRATPATPATPRTVP